MNKVTISTSMFSRELLEKMHREIEENKGKKKAKGA